MKQEQTPTPSEEECKVYLTKHCLTEGISEATAIRCRDFDMVELRTLMGKPTAKNWYFHGCGRDWHLTMESATAKAEDMRKRKLASIQKQIAKINALDFTKPRA